MPQYRAFDLGVLSGDAASEALGVNDEGAVVGLSSNVATGVKAFVWLFDPMYGFSSNFSMMQLANNAAANDINNAGIAVGRKFVSGNDIAHRWTLASGSVTESSLGTLSGGDHSEAFAINDASPYVIVGMSDSGVVASSCNDDNAGFRYTTAGGMQLLQAGQQRGGGALGVNTPA